MEKLCALASIMAVSLFSQAQTTETKYYSSYEMKVEVTAEKAKFSRTVKTDPKGVETITTNSLKNGKINYSETFRGKEPYGVWIYGRATGTAELDYDFELVYSRETCVGSDKIVKDADFYTDNPAEGYRAPKFAGDESNLSRFIQYGMIYPAYAIRRGIEGVVKTTFTLTKEGKIENIVVNEGVDINLDKEAVRVLRSMKFSVPPTLSGESKDVCVSLPISFKLS